MVDSDIGAAAGRVLDAFKTRGWMLATAESCTGGLIAATLTEIAGSSAVVERGFVTYTNQAKHEMLGVPEHLLTEHGAVSEPVARAMAEGALARSPVQAAVSVTGIAGPGGGTDTKPVGLVHFGLAMLGRAPHTEHHVFPGGRAAVRRATVLQALALFEQATAP